MRTLNYPLLLISILMFWFTQSGCNTASENQSTESSDKTSSNKKIETTHSLQFPKPTDWVSDYEHILDAQSFQTIVEQIKTFQGKTTYQLAVVTTPSFSPYNDITDYSVALGNEWGVGLEEINSGILLIVSTSQRQVRISTGLGMEQILTDEQCQQIVNETILPLFKQQKYKEGILSGVNEIIKTLDFEIKLN